jgi:hypothetical protein
VTYRDEGRKYIDDLRASGSFSEVEVVQGPTDCTINDRPGVRYEVNAVLKKDGHRFRYLITAVDGKQAIFKLVSTIVPSQAETFRSALEEVTRSFTELL